MDTETASDITPHKRKEIAAVERYGARIVDLRWLSFADRVGAGDKPSKIATEFYPDVTEKTAKENAAVLACHPDIVARATLTRGFSPRDLVRLAVPAALQTLYELALGLHGAGPSVRAKASAEILDRGGLPRTAELAVSAVTVSADAIGAILSTQATGPEPNALNRTLANRDTLDRARASWAALLPADITPKT